jgi:hypothetical protein
MQAVNTGRVAAPGFAAASSGQSSDPEPLLRAQASAASAARRPSAPRSVQLQLGGHPVTAVPLGPPGRSGQTLYEVRWRDVQVLTRLTGQIGPAQFTPSSPLKRQLEQALQVRNASKATGDRGSAPSMLRIDLERPDVNSKAGMPRGMFGTNVFVPYVNPDFTSQRAVAVARRYGYPARMWIEQAPNWHTAPRAHAIVELPDTREGGAVYARINFEEVGFSGSQGTLKLPPGASRSFAEGFLQEGRRIALQNLTAIGATVAYGALGAAGARGAAGHAGTGPGRGAGPAGYAGGARTQPAPSATIEVVNGGRRLPSYLPPVARMRPPAPAQEQAVTSRPLPGNGGGKDRPGGPVIDVQVISSETVRSAGAARSVPRLSPRQGADPEAPPVSNQAIVRMAVEWPREAATGPNATTRNGRQAAASALAPQALPARTVTVGEARTAPSPPAPTAGRAPDAVPAPDTRPVPGMLPSVQARAGVAAPRREPLGSGMTLAIYPPGTMNAAQLRAATAAVIVRNPLAWGGLGTRDAHPDPIRGTAHGELPLREQIDKGHFIAIYGPGSIVPRGTVSVVFDARGPGVAYAGKLTSSELGMGAQLIKAAARLADAGGQSRVTWDTLDPRLARMYETRYGARPIREPLHRDGPPYLFEYDLNDPGVRKRNELPARPHAALTDPGTALSGPSRAPTAAWRSALDSDDRLAERLRDLERGGWQVRVDDDSPAGEAFAVPGSRTIVLSPGTDATGTPIDPDRLARVLDRAISTAHRLNGILGSPRPAGGDAGTVLEPAVLSFETRRRDEMRGAIWYTPEQRERFRIVVGPDGRLLWAQSGEPVDSARARSRHSGAGTMTIVLDPAGRFYGGTQIETRDHPEFTRVAPIFHSSYTSGGDVAFAGEMRVRDGRLEAVTDESWHYRPEFRHSAQFIAWLRGQGVDLRDVGFLLYEGAFPARR